MKLYHSTLFLPILADKNGYVSAYCGCDSTCTDDVWNTLATDASGSYTCGGRITWLQTNQGYSERDACIRVSANEFPNGPCGPGCDPNKCNNANEVTPPPTPVITPPPTLQPTNAITPKPTLAPTPVITLPPTLAPTPPPVTANCGCESCTDEVWNTPATDSAGSFSCGSRITWLQTDRGYNERDACIRVADEFSNGPCGPACDPNKCNNIIPSPSSSSSPSTSSPTRAPSSSPSRAPSPSPSLKPVTDTPSKQPTLKPVTTSQTLAPTSPPTSPTSPPSTSYCECKSCTEEVWNSLATDVNGSFSCGSRITWLQTNRGYDEVGACIRVSEEFPSGPCGPACDPNKCNVTPPPPTPPPVNPTTTQKCGGAVDASNDPNQECQASLWDPADDTSMYCFAYGGAADPCHLNNNNDVEDGLFKDPSMCYADTFYLWDEPDTQGRDYDWAGSEWLAYSERFASQLKLMRSRGAKVTSPLLTAGGSGTLESNMRTFMNACGQACYDESDPAYIDIIAINAFCGPWNDQYGGCRAGASFIYNEAAAVSNAFNGISVYITNWSRLQTSSASEQLDAIGAVDEFFPSSGGVIERVYWFGARDFGGGSTTTSYLTNVLPDGSTLGDAWRTKCDSINV